jgi:cytoskeletal protein RodZ
MAEMDRIAGDVTLLQDDMSEVKEKLVEHETRLSNGRHAMHDIRERVEKLEPKAPDWLKLMLAGLSVVGVLMGAQLWLTDRFNARPTHSEVDKMVHPIQETQKETAREIGDIEKSQSAQATSIRNIEKTQAVQGEKIDTILERLPPRRGSR